MKKKLFERLINSYYSTLFIAVVAIYFLYYKLISLEWFNYNIVLKIFDKLSFNEKEEKLFLLIIFFILISVLYKSIKYKSKPSLFSTFLVINFFIIYILERIRLFDNLELYKFNLFNVAIIDFVVIIIITVFILKWSLFWLSSKYKKNKNVVIPFLKDSIYASNENRTELNEDIFNREIFAKKIANKLIGLKGEGSFNLGIQGPWGCGKTYMLKLLNQELKGKVISIEYNPWKSFEEKNIVKTFFNTLSQELKNYDEAIVHNLNRYSSYLLNSVDINIWKFSLKKNESIGKLYKDINERICELKMPVVVFIDDLDRLDKAEIMDIFKLIRNTANFSNVIFITAFDLTYLTDTVFNNNENQKTEYSNYNYLEKIFQTVFTLPAVDNFIMLEHFKKILTNNSPIIELKFLDDFENSTNNHEKIILSCLKNYRDLVRFSNQFCLDIEFIDKEIDFEDFLLFELIKYKNPKLIEEIYSNKSILKKSEAHDGYDSDFNIIKGKYDPLYISILGEIFGHHGAASINNVNNFYKYFSLSIFTHDIGFEEFRERIFNSDENILILLNSWLYRNVELNQILYKFNLHRVSNYFNFENKEKTLEILRKYITGYKYLIINYKLNNNSLSNDFFIKLRDFLYILHKQITKLINNDEFENSFIKGYFEAPKVIIDFYIFHFLNKYKRNEPDQYMWISIVNIQKYLGELYIDTVLDNPDLDIHILLVNFRCINSENKFYKEKTRNRLLSFDNFKYFIENSKEYDNEVKSHCESLQLIYKSSLDTLKLIFDVGEINKGITDEELFELNKITNNLFDLNLKIFDIYQILSSNFIRLSFHTQNNKEKYLEILNKRVIDSKYNNFYKEFIPILEKYHHFE